MARLSYSQKAFVVTRLASFDTPTEVSRALRREFDVTLARQNVEYYDPTTKAGEKLPDRWRKMFFQRRETFLKSLEDIPLANKAVRIRWLSQMTDMAQAEGSLTVAASLIEQIAKEMGGFYTKRKSISERGDDGPIDLTMLTDEQLDAHIATLLGGKIIIEHDDDPDPQQPALPARRH